MRVSNHHQSVFLSAQRSSLSGYCVADLCVFDVDRVNGILTLVELADGVTVDKVRKQTEADFVLAETIGKMESDD